MFHISSVNNLTTDDNYIGVLVLLPILQYHCCRDNMLDTCSLSSTFGHKPLQFLVCLVSQHNWPIHKTRQEYRLHKFNSLVSVTWSLNFSNIWTTYFQSFSRNYKPWHSTTESFQVVLSRHKTVFDVRLSACLKPVLHSTITNLS